VSEKEKDKRERKREREAKEVHIICRCSDKSLVFLFYCMAFVKYSRDNIITFKTLSLYYS
jgi:hypothetical protein